MKKDNAVHTYVESALYVKTLKFKTVHSVISHPDRKKLNLNSILLAEIMVSTNNV